MIIKGFSALGLLFFLLSLSTNSIYSQGIFDRLPSRASVKAEERLEKAEEVYQRTRENHLRLKEELGDEVTESLLNRARERSKAALAVVSRHQDLFRERIEKSSLTAEEKSNLLAGLAADEEFFTEAAARIDEAETLEELRDINSEIRERWRSRRQLVHRSAGLLHSQKHENLLLRLQSLLGDLRSEAEQNSAEGLDITSVNGFLNEAESELTLANSLYNEARGIISAADDLSAYEEARTLYQEALTHLKAAHEALRLAFQELNK